MACQASGSNVRIIHRRVALYHLQNMVQLMQRQLPWHDNPSPDRGLNLG